MAEAFFSRKNKSVHPALRARCKGNIASEFPLAVFVLLLFAVFPLLDLIGVALGTGTVALITTQLASRASTQQTYDRALNAVLNEASTLEHSGFANLIKMRPTGGYKNSGADLYIVVTSYKDGQSTSYGPNTPVPGIADPSTGVYEYTACTNYNIGPLISFHSVPFLCDIPGIGRPMQIKWSACRAAENVEGTQAASLPTTWNFFNRLQVGPAATTAGANNNATNPNAGWRDPNIYNEIAQAGQTVVESDGLIVEAGTTGWTNSNITIHPGDIVWMDTQAVGASTSTDNNQGDKSTDANGYTSFPGAHEAICPAFNYCALVGYAAGNPPPLNSMNLVYNVTTPIQGTAPNTNPNPNVVIPGTVFFVGNTLQNYQVQPGPLSFRINCFGGNLFSGQQFVRIIITKAAS